MGLTKATRFVYSILKSEAIVVQWSEHRLVTSEVAGSSPVSRELLSSSLGRQGGCPPVHTAAAGKTRAAAARKFRVVEDWVS